jgi:hypothetical protein
MPTVRIENHYSDGHQSTREVTLAHPREIFPDIDTADEEQVDEWFQVVVFQYTGDGHGADNDLGSCYTATIIDTDDPDLVDRSFEWTD